MEIIHVTLCHLLPDMDTTVSVPLTVYLRFTVIGHEFTTAPYPPNYARGRLLE